jgi:methylated-DNA-[protein]-cysteine S-methyltransferase
LNLEFDRTETPLGTIMVVVARATLCALDFGDCEGRQLHHLRRRFGDVDMVLAKDPGGTCKRINAYFRGELDAFEGVEVESRGTPFQELVWRALRAIAPGETVSYGELAARIGRPTAARAVGLANRLNPVALVIPCHRVIGANGGLTGYAGGLDRKRWLLEHEGALAADPLFPSLRQRS